MSYDLMVFDPDTAPRNREDFKDWYEHQTDWTESHSYNDPGVCTLRLRAWFMEMIGIFPAMNGPFASEEFPEDESLVADYSLGKSSIYVTFAWSKANDAYQTTLRLAEKHALGFYDVSSPEVGEVWLPSESGALSVAHTQERAGTRIHTIGIGIKDLN